MLRAGGEIVMPLILFNIGWIRHYRGQRKKERLEDVMALIRAAPHWDAFRQLKDRPLALGDDE